ncbi:hypothetical protein C8Q77DRAFT_1131817 [Trametes polyzona]|nr:hypothetical protein C8Q77DRAFT_1131817 [Trametes polyzona]
MYLPYPYNAPADPAVYASELYLQATEHSVVNTLDPPATEADQVSWIGPTHGLVPSPYYTHPGPPYGHLESHYGAPLAAASVHPGSNYAALPADQGTFPLYQHQVLPPYTGNPPTFDRLQSNPTLASTYTNMPCGDDTASLASPESQTNKPKSDRVPCSQCSQTFTRKWNMEQHVKSVHLHERPFPCPSCPKQFARKYDRMQHVARTHRSAAR